MNSPSARPPVLEVLCALFVFWSALTLLACIPHWQYFADDTGSSFNMQMDLGVFAFVAAIGLWHFSSACRTFAIVLTWYWIVGAGLLFFELFPVSSVLPGFKVTFTVVSNSDFLQTVPVGLLRVLVVPFFLVQIWQLKTLKRPEFKALYMDRHISLRVAPTMPASATTRRNDAPSE